MDREYNQIYEMLYADYIYESDLRLRRRPPFPYSEYYLVKAIRKSIDKADRGDNLRPDAKYFLIVNFHHLIVRPLIERSAPNEIRKDFPDLEEIIQYDIETIISETKREREEEGISGHQIMKTIDRLWKNLKTTKINIWG